MENLVREAGPPARFSASVAASPQVNCLRPIYTHPHFLDLLGSALWTFMHNTRARIQIKYEANTALGGGAMPPEGNFVSGNAFERNSLFNIFSVLWSELFPLEKMCGL